MTGRNVLSARRANESAARQGYILDAEEASSESLLTWLLGLLVVLVTITLGLILGDRHSRTSRLRGRNLQAFLPGVDRVGYRRYSTAAQRSVQHPSLA